MINPECYHKNWNSEVCSQKCKLYTQCHITWLKYIENLRKTTPINISIKEAIKILISK